MARAALRVLESDVQASIIDYLLLRGALIIRVNSGGMHGEHGGKKRYVQFVRFPGEQGVPDNMKKSCSDILALHNGTLYAIECKRPGEKPTRKQANFLEAVRAKGGVGIVATRIDDVQKAVV